MTTNLPTPAELARLEELHAKATQGEWFHNATAASGARCVWNTDGDVSKVPRENERQICLAPANSGRFSDLFFEGCSPPPSEIDANLKSIAAAHNALPALIAGCREAERLRAGLAAKVAEWRDTESDD